MSEYDFPDDPLGNMNEHIEQLRDASNAIAQIARIHEQARDQYILGVDFDEMDDEQVAAQMRRMDEFVTDKMDDLPDDQQAAMDHFNLWHEDDGRVSRVASLSVGR